MMGMLLCRVTQQVTSCTPEVAQGELRKADYATAAIEIRNKRYPQGLVMCGPDYRALLMQKISTFVSRHFLKDRSLTPIAFQLSGFW